MKSKMEIFDSARIKLQKGVNLVEASAGTGKTYAISMLVLRCVAELDIPIDKILIVTFTKAAAEELRSRIRAKIVEGRDLLRGALTDPDQTLAEWGKTVIDKIKVQDRLQLALYDIDRAGIFTIHSFCQRMLQEQALESGQLFDVELLADIDHIRRQVVDDFWRSEVYPLAPLPCTILCAAFSCPEKLRASVSGVPSDSSKIEPVTKSLEDTVTALAAAYKKMSVWWQQNSHGLLSQYTENRVFFKKPLKDDLDSWWQTLDGFFAGNDFQLPDHFQLLSREGLMGALNGNKLRGIEKKRQFLAEWLLPDGKIEELLDATANLVLVFRVRLAQALGQEVAQRLQEQGRMSFDDLIVRLSIALEQKEGAELQSILALRYSVALIDEFQDTDARQWHIFSTLFGGGIHYLYLIGDPKQAIYRFRGADIHSYFEARETAQYHLTLERNYRTHPHLVEEVNRLFSSRSQPFSLETMAYHPVAPAKSVEDGWLQRGNTPLANMVYCQLPEYPDEKNGRWTSGKAAEQFLLYTVAEVSRLLANSNPVHLSENDSDRRITPKDIAILVRTNRQAEEYVKALAPAGIPVVMASKQSVFQTDECHEIYLLLQALATPGDIRLLKTAMTISWFGFTGNDLVETWRDDDVFDGWHSRFLLYYQLWRDQGILTMMNRLLFDEQVFITLAKHRFAERRIANIHHLLELIQEAESRESFGPGQTLQWLRTMMQDTKGAESVELRLESDEEAVRIVTMHGAKGLEYPIVFCPYLWYRSNRLKNEQFIISCHDKGPVTDLGSKHFEKRRELAVEEELAEDLRLLYVALTRAGLRCYTMWADVKPIGSVGDSFSSPLGYLLFPDGKTDHATQMETLAKHGQGPAVDHLLLSEKDGLAVRYKHKEEGSEKLACRLSSGRSLQTDWQMSSYSAMASLSEDREHNREVSHSKSMGAEPHIPVAGLPAGANFGNLIHDSLEELSFFSLAAEEDCNDFLSEKCRRYGIDAEPDVLRQLLANIVTTPLLETAGSYVDVNGFCLSGLQEERCLKEMPFYFHLDRMITKDVNGILAGDPAFTPLSQRVMQGYLTGFVDLICEHGGKYFVLDYKTNYLGERLSDYSSENLVLAMADHNYGLQYWIYTLVLDRYLRNVLPGYCYEYHFGGVMYLFVRGMVPSLPGSGVFSTLPDRTLLEKLAVCLGGAPDV